MNDQTLRRRIAQIAGADRNSTLARVVLLPHAKKQMGKRMVSLTQVYEVLQKGYVIEPAHRDIYGCWKCTLEYLVAGDRVKVAAALCQNEEHETVVVITVMN